MALEQWKLQQNLPDNHMDAPPFAGYVQAKALASGVAELVTVPSGATHVVMRGTADFAALAGGTGAAAAWPTDVSDGSASELNPDFRRLRATDTHISVIAASSCVVTLAFHQVKFP